ncbi:sigma-54-dependent Fis family transcriptional regulator [Streptomyces fuscichromogenes]|uniref:Fis family transcriptional regulator n=1 Tax=Streptomyces fuscichromogenes TaxID=1324013 RepID=A0A918CTK2_9ACTN|nr:helix-turn-helix domain-containing protein [Streptomyces fuscichromogenes]GGN21376.1 Fis family transcriptional regulator [Streptomyces fuscichromogenes]
MTTAEHPSPAGRQSSGRPALGQLRRARARFLAGYPLSADVPDEVAAAWRRARFHGVRHDSAAPFEGGARRSPDPALLAAARPVLERLGPVLDHERVTLLLTDARLRVLWSAGHAPRETLCADLSEQSVGPNSAALALRTGHRAELHGPEHFLDVWQEISAVSVPLRAPGDDRPVGTVTVASALCGGCAPHPQAALAEATAAGVEAELRARASPPERALLDAYLTACEGPDRPVVAFAGHSRLVSEAAGRLLSPRDIEDLERAAHTALREDTTGARLPYGAALHVVRHLGETAGAVISLEPASGTAPAVPAGRPPTTLAGRSVPWRHATERAAELAVTRAPLLLVGERGTGKTSLARALLDGSEPLVVDAAEGDVPEALPADPRGWLVLRHAERLAQPDVAAIVALLEARPTATLLVTYTPGAPPGPCLQRLLDTLAARSVTLPALRERPEDIGELLTALAPAPQPGQPTLTWSLDARRALERYPWPGNVTELAHVVRSLARQRRAVGPVRRTELPDPVREGPAGRPLSPMEHAERTAILEALRRHGGNKARTAAALGIGRATLYRKLRTYGSHA